MPNNLALQIIGLGDREYPGASEYVGGCGHWGLHLAKSQNRGHVIRPDHTSDLKETLCGRKRFQEIESIQSLEPCDVCAWILDCSIDIHWTIHDEGMVKGDG